MPWPPKCTAKVVQCSVCGAENAHPGANGVHLCDACAPNHGYFCKHCGKYHLTPGGFGPAYPCPKCKGLLCSKCFDKVKTVGLGEELVDELAYATQPSDADVPLAGKVEAIKHTMEKTGWSQLEATKFVGKYKPHEYVKLYKASVETLNAIVGTVSGLPDPPLSTWGKQQEAAYKLGYKDPTTGEVFNYSELEAKIAGKLVKPKKLPKGFVTHTMSTKAQPLFHPDKSQQQVFAEWELEPMLDLTRAAADYYLLALMDSLQDKKLNKVLKPKLEAHLEFMDTQFQRYLHMAVGGELRHARRYYNGLWTAFAPEIVGLFKNTSMKGGRHDAWHVWRAFVETHGWEKTAGWAAQVFNAGHWSASFGGKNWGNVAVTLHRRLKGEITPLVFVDTTLGLQHNTGCVFNKKVGWSYTGLQKVLDAGRQVDFDKAQPMQVLVDYASDVTTTLLEKVLEGYVKGEYKV